MFASIFFYKPIIFDNTNFTQLTLLSYPTLSSAAQPIFTTHDIYDTAFSPTTVSPPTLALSHSFLTPTYQLVIATTHNLLIYGLPPVLMPDSPSGKKGKNKKKNRSKSKSISVPELELLRTVELPQLPADGGSFRAAKYDFLFPLCQPYLLIYVPDSILHLQPPFILFSTPPLPALEN